MKKLNLSSNPLNRGEILSRAQLKKVMGGSGSGSDHGCSVTCESGKYACCNPGSVIGMPTCKCYANGTTQTCKNGGAGASQCSITLD